jgi:hypothetical protein
MRQIISKDGVVYCDTSVPYPPNVVKDMKSAGYTVKTIKDEESPKTTPKGFVEELW